MSFDLKNTDATYQWAMTYIFHDMMDGIMEYYIDDILGKSTTHEGHWDVFYKVFQCLLEHNIRLKKKKCIFGVTLGKLLGFIVFKQGIKTKPKKVKAIIDIPPPHDIKFLRSL